LVFGGGVQIDSGAGSEHVKVRGPVKPPFPVTVTVGLAVAPCVTVNDGAVGARVKADDTVTVAAVEVEFATDPLPP